MRFDEITRILGRNQAEECWGSAQIDGRTISFCLEEINLRVETSNKEGDISAINVYLYFADTLLFHVEMPRPKRAALATILASLVLPV
jgi:hypothetical protein